MRSVPFLYSLSLMGVLALVVLLSGCASTGEFTAGAAVPLAFAADTVLFPPQYLGKCSQALMQRGYNVDHYINEYNGTYEYVHQPSMIDLVYYVPGYALGPFLPFSKMNYYGMTKTCVNTALGPPRRQPYIYASR